MVVGPDRRRGARGRRRRISMGSRRHVHPAGGAARPRACGAHRAIVRARPALPDVSGRQRAARGPRHGSSRSSSGPGPTRRSSWLGCPNPNGSVSPSSRGTAWCDWWRSLGSRSATSPSSACTCSTTRSWRRPTRLEPSATRGTRDHRGDPVAGRPRQDGPRRDGRGLVEGHRQARRSPRGQPHDALGRSNPRTRERVEATTVEGTVVIAAGAKITAARSAVPS